MVAMSNELQEELRGLASKHHTVESFLEDMERIGVQVWHTVRSNGDHAQEPLVEDEELQAPPATPGTPGTPGSPPTPSEDAPPVEKKATASAKK